ncbi:hypothetical protein BGW41_006331 [Actinomortierella wolfii]|nr:hypothetical protein BGW41_006331 [Actinomortierella wolfii]
MQSSSPTSSKDNDSNEPLYLGLDLSTQQLKVVALEPVVTKHVACQSQGGDNTDKLDDNNDGKEGSSVEFRLHSSFAVHFDSELSHYHTQGGVHAYGSDGRSSCQSQWSVGGDDPLWTPGTVTSPVLMWIEALERVLDKMQKAEFPFHRVRCIGGSAQQHGSVYWSEKGQQALERLHQKLPDDTKSLAEHFVQGFTIYNSPIWQDTSTWQQCKQLEEFLSTKASDKNLQQMLRDINGFDSAGTLMAELTGSRAFERFTASQILKIAQTVPDLFQETVRISLVSSFLASLFVGHFASIDVADGSGMNLLDISSKAWDPYLTEFISFSIGQKLSPTLQREVIERCNHHLSNSGQAAEDSGEETKEMENRLTKMLGPVDATGRTVQGVLAPWFVQKYGFQPTTTVTSFTGDNPATALAMQLHPGDAIVSLGTSDTVMLYTSANPFDNPCPAHSAFIRQRQLQRKLLLNSMSHNDATSILCHPLDPQGFLTLYCAKNGSLAREHVRNENAGGQWELFDDLIFEVLERRRKVWERHVQKDEESNAPREAKPEDWVTRLGYYYFEREIWPPVKGVHRFEDGRPVTEFTGADEAEIRQHNVLAICESQLLAMRMRTTATKNKDTLGSTNPSLVASGSSSKEVNAKSSISRILATGGGSKSRALLQLMANIFNVPVVPMSEDGWMGSAAWGAATKAYLCAVGNGDTHTLTSSSVDQQNVDSTDKSQGDIHQHIYRPDPVHAAYYAQITKHFLDIENSLMKQNSLDL